MKRTLIGGFLALLGSVWAIPIWTVSSENLVDSWVTPPGRLICTLLQYGSRFPLLFACILSVLGLAILTKEYFTK